MFLHHSFMVKNLTPRKGNNMSLSQQASKIVFLPRLSTRCQQTNDFTARNNASKVRDVKSPQEADRDTHQAPVPPALPQVPALPAAAEPRLTGQRWPGARLTAPLLGHQVQKYEGQLTLTALTGLTAENKRRKQKERSIRAVSFKPFGESQMFHF